jgi:MFS family permease
MKLPLMNQRDFRLIWIGQMLSILGSRFSELALPWIVLHNTGSPLKAGLVVVCSQIAPLLLALPAGAWIENQRKRPIAIWAELSRAVAMLVLVIAAIMNVLSVWIIALVLLFNGLAGLMFRISFHSMLPHIVGRKNLLEAHNYLEGADAISTLIGPLLAGVTFAALGATGTLSIDALTFLISFITIVLIQYHERIPKLTYQALPDTSTKWGQTLKGMKHLVGNNVQRLLTLNHWILHFCTVSVTLLAIILAQKNLLLSIEKTGLLFSAAGLGNIIGVYLISRLKSLPWGIVQASLFFVSALGIVLLASAHSLVWALLGMFLFDGALSMSFVVHGSVRQAITPDHLLARISSTGFLISGLAGIIGSLYAGGIAEWLDSRIALAFCAVLLLVGGIITLMNRSIHQPINQVEPMELE